VISSPLLVRRARSSGGSGGIRVTLEREGGGFVVRSAGARSREFHVANSLAAAQSFNAEVEAARRDGYTSVPEPAVLTAQAVERGLRA
jgi:hypothetical protein